MKRQRAAKCARPARRLQKRKPPRSALTGACFVQRFGQLAPAARQEKTGRVRLFGVAALGDELTEFHLLGQDRRASDALAGMTLDARARFLGKLARAIEDRSLLKI